MKLFRSLIIGLCVLCAGVAAWADDGAIVGVGGAATLMKPEHATVRMVKERVDVKLIHVDNRLHAAVHCEFEFKNEGNAVTVRMGFPESGGGGEVNARDSLMDYFKSSVNGRSVKTKFVISNAWSGEYDGWHVKDVTFKAGETVRVVDDYAAPLGIEENGSYLDFRYVLKTGASWKGRIGEAVVNVDLSGLPLGWVREKTTQGFVVRGKRITWKLRNVEPTSDINIDFARRFPRLSGCGVEFIDYTMRGKVAMVPVSSIEEACITKVTHGRYARSCVINFRGRTLAVAVGSRNAILNGHKRIVLPAAPFVMEHREMMIPVDALAWVLGRSYSYDWRADGGLDVTVHVRRRGGKRK